MAISLDEFVRLQSAGSDFRAAMDRELQRLFYSDPAVKTARERAFEAAFNEELLTRKYGPLDVLITPDGVEIPRRDLRGAK